MPKLEFPPPARQIYIQHFLREARGSILHEQVRVAAAAADPRHLRQEIVAHVPAEGLQALQATGVRDELVFAVPCVLRHTPTALGYYRLLLGASQKRFYGKATGLSPFKSMEDRNEIRGTQESSLETLCFEMNKAMTTLVTSLPSEGLRDDVEQLPVMTLGAQADGSWRTHIGKEATKGVFDALKKVIKENGFEHVDNGNSIAVINSSKREVTLALAADPDVSIMERVNSEAIFKVAIEIKGGTDYSNVYNRAGEAEKSHLKAYRKGAQDFWTVISLTGIGIEGLKSGSPSTRQWFDVEEVMAGAGPSWERLVNHTISAMGI